MQVRHYVCMDDDCPPERKWLARLEKEIPTPAGKAPAHTATVIFASDPDELLPKVQQALAEEAARKGASR
jgi:hypothetical protein